MSRGRKLGGLTKSSDIRKVYDANSTFNSEFQEIDNLGKKFLADKKLLESKLDEARSKGLSEEHMKQVENEIADSIAELQEHYQDEVVKEQQALQEDAQKDINTISGISKEFENEAQSLQSVEISTKKTDTQKASDAALRQKESFEANRKKYLDDLNAKMKAAQIQKAEMLRNKLSGK